MIDGYLVPKNDDYFNEYVNQSSDRLKFISNFSGSAGFAVIMKNKNYLFVDGRYTIQAQIQSGKKFKVITIPEKLHVELKARLLYDNLSMIKLIWFNTLSYLYTILRGLKKISTFFIPTKIHLKILFGLSVFQIKRQFLLLAQI